MLVFVVAKLCCLLVANNSGRTLRNYAKIHLRCSLLCTTKITPKERPLSATSLNSFTMAPPSVLGAYLFSSSRKMKRAPLWLLDEPFSPPKPALILLHYKCLHGGMKFRQIDDCDASFSVPCTSNTVVKTGRFGNLPCRV